MLLEFNKMNEAELYRMVHEVYIEGSRELAKEKHPELEDLSETICEEEHYYVEFLKEFLEKEKNKYYVYEVDGAWVSALRLTRLDGFYYMETLETAPEYRKKGYAAKMIEEVITLLGQRGPVIIRSNVDKSNRASLVTHEKCGFRIERESGINCLTGEQRDYVYGMIYETE